MALGSVSWCGSCIQDPICVLDLYLNFFYFDATYVPSQKTCPVFCGSATRKLFSPSVFFCSPATSKLFSLSVLYADDCFHHLLICCWLLFITFYSRFCCPATIVCHLLLACSGLSLDYFMNKKNILLNVKWSRLGDH